MISVTLVTNLTIQEAIRIAADGDAILFVGAGVGFLTRNSTGPLPDGRRLSNRMLGRADDEPNAPPLDRAAGYAIRKGMGVEGVYQLLMSQLSVVEVDPRLSKLYQLPWRRVYTTNYDTAIEQARKGVVPTNSCTLETPIDRASNGTILHINGCIKNISPASIEKELSLSDFSYATRNFENSPWLGFFSRDIEVARAVIFVGYSLYDLDIARVIIGSDIAEKTFFFVSPDVDEVDEDNISLYGQSPGGGAIALLDLISPALESYTPPIKYDRFINLREIGTSFLHNPSEPSKVLNAQLIYGVLPEQQVIEGVMVAPNIPFIVQRTQVEDALNQLRRGAYQDVLVTGEFVSGKSSAALSIVSEFVKQGYRAFFATHGPRLTEDLANLAQIDDRIVVVFEGYSTFRRTILQYARSRTPKHRLLLTEQSVQHELYGDFLNAPALAGRIYEIILDRISSDDTPSFEALLDFGGYWGDRAGYSKEVNSRFISSNLEGSLYRLLLEVLQSKDVQQRIDNLLQPILTSKKAAEVFVSACITNVLGVKFRISDWIGAFDSQFVSAILRNYDETIRYFLLVQSGSVFPRSGVLSASILQRVNDRNIILESALKLFRVASKQKSPYNIYDDIVVRLMQFNRLQPIMNGPNEKSLILAFYEQIRPIAETFRNPDYWLQLGIAATAFDEFDTARDAFQNAYDREEKRDKPNFIRIDNYYNRYLLKYASFISDSSKAFDLFEEATAGLKRQMMLEDNRHYPFKSSRSYGQIAYRHYANWNSDQRSRFVSETRSIREKAQEYKIKSKNRSRDVEVLIKETGELLIFLESK